MRRLLLVAVSTCIFCAVSPAAVLNPGFEAGPADGPADNWTETNSLFGYNRCRIAVFPEGCTDPIPAPTTVGPLSGVYWQWFGGVTEPITGESSQSGVTFGNTGDADFSFNLWYGQGPAAPGQTADLFEVLIDGTVVFFFDPGLRPTTLGYELITLSADAYADGLGHTVLFRYTQASDTRIDISIDDLSILEIPEVPPPTGEVPEPGTLALLASGGVALATLRRKR